jgi:hypothetical protein
MAIEAAKKEKQYAKQEKDQLEQQYALFFTWRCDIHKRLYVTLDLISKPICTFSCSVFFRFRFVAFSKLQLSKEMTPQKKSIDKLIMDAEDNLLRSHKFSSDFTASFASSGSRTWSSSTSSSSLVHSELIKAQMNVYVRKDILEVLTIVHTIALPPYKFAFRLDGHLYADHLSQYYLLSSKDCVLL